MNPAFRRRTYVLSALALLLLMGLTYWVVLREYPLPKLREALTLASPGLLVLALLCAACFVLGEAACIRAILKPLGYRIPYGGALSYSLIGAYFSAITPSSSGGQPAQIYYMNKRGIPVAQGTITMLLITVVYKLVLLAVGLPLAFIDAPVVFIGIPYFRVLFFLGIVVNIALICGCLLLMFSKKTVYRLTDWLLRLMEHLHLHNCSEKTRERLDRQLDEYHAAADYLAAHRGVMLKVIALTVFQRLAVFTTAYCVYRAFGLDTLNWGDVIAIQAAISLAVDSLPLPGATGAAEGVFLGLYTSIYGQTLVVPALLLTRGATYYLPALLSGLFTAGYVVYGSLTQRKKGKKT